MDVRIWLSLQKLSEAEAKGSFALSLSFPSLFLSLFFFFLPSHPSFLSIFFSLVLSSHLTSSLPSSLLSTPRSLPFFLLSFLLSFLFDLSSLFSFLTRSLLDLLSLLFSL